MAKAYGLANRERGFDSRHRLKLSNTLFGVELTKDC